MLWSTDPSESPGQSTETVKTTWLQSTEPLESACSGQENLQNPSVKATETVKTTWLRSTEPSESAYSIMKELN